ncbi:MAG: M23 family metallopeptidase, partial [Actinomycetota bacterium]
MGDSGAVQRILLRLAVVILAVGAVLAALLTPALLVLPSDAAESPSAGDQMPRFLPFLGDGSVHCTQGNPAGPAGSGCEADPTLGRPIYHPFPAVDFRLATGTPVRATGSGVVTAVAQDTGDEAFEDADGADYNGLRGAGLFVVVRHENAGEERLSAYKHMGEAVVAEGDWVEAGQIVGLVGRSEATGLHLHYDEQASMDRFQFEDNRLPLGPLSGECDAIIDWDGPTGIPKGTRVPVPGWSCGNDFHGDEPLEASTGEELQAALDELAGRDGPGPFTVRLASEDEAIDLDGSPLRWDGAGLLVLDGDPDDDGVVATVRNPAGRVLESSAAQAVELRNLVLEAGGAADGSGGVVQASGALTVVESVVRGGEAADDGGGLSSGHSIALVRTWVDRNRAGGD